MSNHQIFNHQTFGELPVIVINGMEWFGATEAARALSFSDPYKAITNHVDEEDSTVRPVLTDGGQQNKKFINESGLYSLVFGAAKQGNNADIQAKAKEFKRWVTREILPTIRRTGSYSVDKPKSQAELLLMYAKSFVEMEQRVERVETAVTTIQETFTQRDEDWRSSINTMLNGAAYRSGTPYRELRTESYRLLEERGHCDLNARLRNLTKRLEDAGAMGN
ncbi:BRO-N domain-containing protein [Cohnella massiliensis]|uniref:BRO-N domain-containing protein n=1 Tax=Cohnella massiliensis TaxID=1816691 RepID=UPI0009BB434A|nr:BRO family protein [Cohnella massiliensis]